MIRADGPENRSGALFNCYAVNRIPQEKVKWL